LNRSKIIEKLMTIAATAARRHLEREPRRVKVGAAVVELTKEEAAALQALRDNGGYEFEPGWGSVYIDDAYADVAMDRDTFSAQLSQLVNKGLYRKTDSSDIGEVKMEEWA